MSDIYEEYTLKKQLCPRLDSNPWRHWAPLVAEPPETAEVNNRENSFN